MPEPGRQGARTVRRQVGLHRGRRTGAVGTGRAQSVGGLGLATGITAPGTRRRGHTRERGVPERGIHPQALAGLYRLRETPRRPT